jgi:hypothetical protein
MTTDSLVEGVRPVETAAERYRNRSRELREAARSTGSQESQRDLEWVARRYEIMANSAEELEGVRQPAPAFRLR